MTRLLVQLMALAVLALAVTSERAASAETERLRFLAYNVHHCEGIDGKLDVERIAKVIRTASPDVVALQEVDRGALRTNRIDEPRELAKLTEMQAIFQKNIDHEGGDYGNAILSKLPMKLREDIKFPSQVKPEPTSEREQRGALVVEVRAASGAQFLFVSTHLDHRRQDDERYESAQVLNDWFRHKQPELPAILAGDLNSTPQSRVLARLEEMWQIADKGDELSTVPVQMPRRQIDFILYRPASRWRVIDVRVLDEDVASDHRPLLTTLELLTTQR